MSAKEMKALYESLLESGDLYMLLPDATGEWKTDKKQFSNEYKQNRDSLYGQGDIYLGDDLFLSEDGF